ncbi:MAG: hypothetical protein LBV00_09355 [Propionibacteriaceae bacterium]|jgi:hypothetical protein|nr:hypothetical protein [Propionibacteriaceae bacterium]
MSKLVEASDPVRKRRARVGLIVALVVIVVLGLVAGFAIWHGQTSRAAETRTHQTRTAKIERTSLVAGFVMSGTLAYGAPTTLGGGGGVVTKLPQVGQTVATGQVVMEVEGSPVFLLQGDIPLWRAIGPGSSGVDVAMVRDALIKLGLSAGTAGAQDYDQGLSDGIAQLYANAGYQRVPATADQAKAQEAAQQALSTAKDGLATAQAALDAAKKKQPGRAELLQADTAVNQAQAAYDAVLRGECESMGATQSGCGQVQIVQAKGALDLAIAQRDDLKKPADTTNELLAVTEAQRGVDKAQAEFDTTQGNMVAPQSVLMAPEAQIRIDGVSAKLGVPADGAILTWTRTLLYGKVDLSEAQRRLLASGAAATLKLPDGSELQGKVGEITDSKTDTTTGQVTPASARIDLDDQAGAAAAGLNAVTVTFVQDTAEDTLVVPVTALMALAEGGYCVERPDGTLVGVEVGLVADTRAQISTDELREGDEVIIP